MRSRPTCGRCGRPTKTSKTSPSQARLRIDDCRHLFVGQWRPKYIEPKFSRNSTETVMVVGRELAFLDHRKEAFEPSWHHADSEMHGIGSEAAPGMRNRFRQ